MSRISRIKPKITDLPLSSLVKVFGFLDELLNEYELSTQFFKDNINSFTLGEQYFICKYIQDFFFKKDTYIQDWLDSKKQIYYDAESFEEYDEFENAINSNKDRLQNILPSYFINFERRFKTLLSDKIPFHERHYYFNENVINYRIPLYYKPTKFKKIIHEILEGILDEDQIDTYFYNSFAFGYNLHPIKLLNIELTDRTKFLSKIYLIKEAYYKESRYQTEKLIKDSQVDLNKIDKKLQGFYNRLKNEEVGRIHFAKTLYNSFPIYRDNYISKKIKTPNLTLDSFLTSLASNIANRK